MVVKAKAKKPRRKCFHCTAYLVGKDEKEKGICSFCTLRGITPENLRRAVEKMKAKVAPPPEPEVKAPKKKKRRRRST